MSSYGTHKKKSKKRKVPEFELEEIMGDFDIDDQGNYIILRDAYHKLVDKRDRLVNKRGYLSDRMRNVINMDGRIIFRACDLDSDDEIPASYIFEKRKG